jgi:hypothetical protein
MIHVRTPPISVGVGWQYALADLSLILFMVTAAALARQQALPPRPAPAPRAAPAAATPSQPVASQSVALADAVAVWRSGPGAPSLEQWLASQQIDSRQRLTIVARYTGARAQEAFVRAEGAMEGVRKLPAATRMVVEPSSVDDLSATLTWDVGGDGAAR